MRLLSSAILCLVALLMPSLASAQTESERDRGYLTGLIEDSLAGNGRTVRLDGFSGAFSSRATFDELAVGDADGDWLIIRDGAISWRRTALLQGRLLVSELSAAEIELLRRPIAADSGPSPAARDFSLPDLPVSVDIGAIRADRIVIGDSFAGERVEGRASGSLKLDSGEGRLVLNLERTDGKAATINADASFSNATRVAEISLRAEEGKGGLFARWARIPGEPPLSLSASGSGTLDDLSVDLSLTADGVRTVEGTISSATGTDGSEVRRKTAVALTGNVVPLFAPAYQPFFGNTQALDATISQDAAGGLALEHISARTNALTLTGSAQLAADGLPEAFDLAAKVSLPDGDAVVLPVSGAETSLLGATLELSYDASKGDLWRISGQVDGFSRGEIRAGRIRLDGSGQIGRTGTAAAGNGFASGTIAASISGLTFGDPAWDAAFGTELVAGTDFQWSRGAAVSLTNLGVTGDGYELAGDMTIAGPKGMGVIDGSMTGAFRDVARLSALAGRPLSGEVRGKIEGTVEPLGGAFDVVGVVTGEDLQIGQDVADRLLRGVSAISFSVERNLGGTEVRNVSLTVPSFELAATGRITPDTEDLEFSLRSPDIAVLGPGYGGSLEAEANVRREGPTRRFELIGTGRDLRTGQSQADVLLRGDTRVNVALSIENGLATIETATLSNRQMTTTISGNLGGNSGRATVEARLADLAIFAPAFPGPLTIAGEVRGSDAGFALDFMVRGPGQTDARVVGTLARNLETVDLSTTGSVQLAIMNPLLEPTNISGPVAFDLRIEGRPTLSSISGTVRGTGLRLVSPGQGIAVSGIALDIRLAGKTADVRATGLVAGGGSVDVAGTFGLSSPYAVQLSVNLDSALLRDPELFSTRVTGNLRAEGALSGPLRLSGSLMLGKTEILVQSGGFGGDPLLEGMTHLNEPAAVHVTRVRAGQVRAEPEGRASPVRNLSLDIAVSAPQRIFVRGRGLDAELGGNLRLVGPSDDVRAVGQFELIRGRFDILGKRMNLTEGTIELSGPLVPYLRFLATINANGIEAGIRLEGPADEPSISFTSSPPLPEEEIAARILFGRGLNSLSPFQAAQLVTAVGAITGRGGGGIVGRLRQSFGLDDLDVRSGDSGLSVTVGKYLSSNLYIDLSFSDSKTEVSLNLDLTENTKARAFTTTDNRSGLGVFFERDY